MNVSGGGCPEAKISQDLKLSEILTYYDSIFFTNGKKVTRKL
jgi:hypothetical protein